MDKFDEMILQQLRLDARQSVQNIAASVHLSRSAVAERIRRMENNGTIRGYRVVTAAPESASVAAFFEVFHTAIKCEDVVPLIARIPEIEQCHGISGETDLLVLCRAASMERLLEIRATIENHPNITKVKTHIIMRQWL